MHENTLASLLISPSSTLSSRVTFWLQISKIQPTQRHQFVSELYNCAFYLESRTGQSSPYSNFINRHPEDPVLLAEKKPIYTQNQHNNGILQEIPSILRG